MANPERGRCTLRFHGHDELKGKLHRAKEVIKVELEARRMKIDAARPQIRNNFHCEGIGKGPTSSNDALAVTLFAFGNLK